MIWAFKKRQQNREEIEKKRKEKINSANVQLLKKCTQIPKSIQLFDEFCCFQSQQSNRIHFVFLSCGFCNKKNKNWIHFDHKLKCWAALYILHCSARDNLIVSVIRTVATIIEWHFGVPLFISLWHEQFHSNELLFAHTYSYPLFTDTKRFHLTKLCVWGMLCLINAFYSLAKLKSSGIAWTNFDGLLNFAFERSSVDWESRLFMWSILFA